MKPPTSSARRFAAVVAVFALACAVISPASAQLTFSFETGIAAIDTNMRATSAWAPSGPATAGVASVKQNPAAGGWTLPNIAITFGGGDLNANGTADNVEIARIAATGQGVVSFDVIVDHATSFAGALMAPFQIHFAGNSEGGWTQFLGIVDGVPGMTSHAAGDTGVFTATRTYTFAELNWGPSSGYYQVDFGSQSAAADKIGFYIDNIRIYQDTTIPLPAAPPAYDWKKVRIDGGGFVSGLVFHPTERNLLYARTDVGGAFRWEEATRSWIPLNDDLGNADSQLTGVLALALDPRDPNRLYLATGQYLPSWARNGAILISADRGATWTRSELSIKLGGNSDGRGAGERLAVDPNRGSILFLGTSQDGLWRSTDSAATWTKVAGFSPASLNFVLFDPRTGTPGSATQTLYAAVNTTTATALWRSTDAGVTWSAVPGQPPVGQMPCRAALASDGKLYLTYTSNTGPNNATAGALWRLDTATGVWTQLPVPTGQGAFSGISVDAQRPSTLLVSTLNRWSPRDEIYRSIDGGATWRALITSAVFDHAQAPWAASITPHWIASVEIDPFNSERAFFVTGYGVFSSENLATTDAGGAPRWEFQNNGLEETVPLGIVSPPSGAPLVSAIADIDGFRHDNLDAVPAARHAPRLGTNQSIDFAENAPAMMVRTHNNGTTTGSRSTDGGSTWTLFATQPPTATSSTPGSIAISADGTRLVWLPNNSRPYYSANAGATWTASTGGPTNVTNLSYTAVADRSAAATFYLYDRNLGRVHRSTDGGASFVAAASVPTFGDRLRAVPGLAGNLFLAVRGNGLHRSTDGGVTFTKLAGSLSPYDIGFGKPAPGRSHPTIFLWGLVGGVEGIHRSDDTGATWARVNDASHQFGYLNALTGDPRVYGRVYLATGGRGILYGDAPPLRIATPDPLPAAAIGASYSTSFEAAGGFGGYTWALTAGTPPAGLAFDATRASLGGTATAFTASDIVLRVTDAAGQQATRAYAVATAQPSYALWKTQRFTTAEQAVEAISAGPADPDGDGLSNLLEWTLARDPKTADASGAFAGALSTAAGDGAPRLVATYTRRKGLGGIVLAPELSTDLVTWTAGSASVEEWQITPDANGITETVTVRAVPPVDATARLFLRLRATTP